MAPPTPPSPPEILDDTDVIATATTPSWRSRDAAGAFPSRKKAAPKPPKPRSTSKSRARLSLVLLAYLVGIVAVITLAPFSFSIPASVDLLVTSEWREAAANVLLFVPLGFLYPLTRQGEDSSPLRVCVAGALLGATLQTMRMFEADNYASIIGVAANATGAAVGAVLLHGVNRRIRASARLAGRLSLEIPLMGLIYLLIPLVLVASLAAIEDPRRLFLLLPLGLLGARLIAAVQEHHFGPGGVFRTRSMAVVAAGWMLLATYPVVLHRPLVGGALVAVVALASTYRSSQPSVLGAERRFEADALTSSTPYVAAYFIGILIIPLVSGLSAWHFAPGFTGSDGELSQQMIRALEPCTSLAVLAYMLSEARGRREMRFRYIASRVVAECACVALPIEASRGFYGDAGASGVELALMMGAALVGAGIYHSQRERIRLILIHRVPAASVPGTKLSPW
jgi:glycopeptide antibiotics resistance protein